MSREITAMGGKVTSMSGKVTSMSGKVTSMGEVGILVAVERPMNWNCAPTRKAVAAMREVARPRKNRRFMPSPHTTMPWHRASVPASIVTVNLERPVVAAVRGEGTGIDGGVSVRSGADAIEVWKWAVLRRGGVVSGDYGAADAVVVFAARGEAGRGREGDGVVIVVVGAGNEGFQAERRGY